MSLPRKAMTWLMCLLVSVNYCSLSARAADGVGAPSDGDSEDVVSQEVQTAQAWPPPTLVPPPPASAPSPRDPDNRPPDGDAATVDQGDDIAQIPGPPAAGPDYVLGSGDGLLIQDYTLGDINSPYQPPVATILPDGTVNIHPVGLVRAAGLSVRELNRLVNEKSKQFYLNPNVEVSVATTRPAKVYILGEVFKPGMYSHIAVPTSSGTGTSATGTGSSGTITVVSALQLAGGLKESADVRRITVTRAGQEPVKIDLWKLMVEGDASQDMLLYPGDVVYAPRGGKEFAVENLGLAANQSRRVRIWGYVKQPGLYELNPDDDVLSIIAKAGGFTGTAKTREVILSRVSREGTITTQTIPIVKKHTLSDSRAVARSLVKPGDLMIVRPSIVKLGAAITYNYFLYGSVGVLLIYLGAIINKSVNGSGGSTPVIPIIPAGGTGGGGG